MTPNAGLPMISAQVKVQPPWPLDFLVVDIDGSYLSGVPPLLRIANKAAEVAIV